MTVYPSELLTLFNESTSVSLVSHKPNIRDVEEYDDWVYVGHSIAMLLIPFRYKRHLFHKLKSLNYTIEIAPFPSAFIKGNQVTFMAILVHCLNEIGCDAVRIQVFGLKAPISLLKGLTAFHSSHPLRHTNFFDIGTTVRPDFTGLSTLKGLGPLSDTFPFCSPVTEGFGTARLRSRLSHDFIDPHARKDQLIETKMYSKIAHVIKSFGGKQPLFKAKTINILKDRFRSAKEHLSKISDKPDEDLQGFRIEATVFATNLTWCLHLALSFNLLKAQTYDGKYELRELSRSAYIDNAKRLINKVQDLNLLKGTGAAKASEEKNQVVADVWQSIGWNNYKWRLTRYNDVDAWWNDRITRREFEKNTKFKSNVFFSERENCTAFFSIVRKKLQCPNCGAIGRFNSVGGVRAFVMRCITCVKQVGKKKSCAMFDELLRGKDSKFYQDAIDSIIERNCSPRASPSIQESSSDSSDSPCLSASPKHPRKKGIPKRNSESSPEPSCPSLYDSPPGRPRKRSVIVIDSDSSEDSPRPRKRMHLEEESSQSPVPESVGSHSPASSRSFESEDDLAGPAEATSTDNVNHEMEEGPKHMVRTLWKSILDRNFPEEA